MSLLLDFINILFWLLNMAIFIRVLMSWINISQYSTFASIIYQITDPILEPLKRVMPNIGMLDITPIVAMVLLDIARRVLITLLFAFA